MKFPFDHSRQDLGHTPAPPEPFREAPALNWRQLLWLALAYFGCAQLSWALATQPSSASPIWLAAGVALFGLLVCGQRYWPAVWFAAFASNLFNYGWLAGNDLTPALEALSALIASGVVLQALLGAQLLRPLLEDAELLEEKQNVLWGLFLVGPLACLASATVGVASLRLFQALPDEAVTSAWTIWWAGDTLGVLLVLPLLLPFMPTLRRTWRNRALQIAVPTLVTCTLVLIGFFWLARAERAEWNAQLATASEGIRDQMTMLLGRQQQRVLAVRDLFRANGEVSRAEFERFSQYSLNHDGLHALAWVPRVQQADRAGVEAAARRDGERGYIFHERGDNDRFAPAGNRLEYFPVLYIAQEPSSFALGYDLASEPANRVAIETAARLAEPVWTKRHAFWDKDANRRDDWRLIVPIYRTGFDERRATPSARREALRGFAAGIFYLGDIFSLGQELAHKMNAAYRITGIGSSGAPSVLFDDRPAALRNLPSNWSSDLNGFEGGTLRLDVWALNPWHPGKSVPILLYLAGAVMATLCVEAFLLVAAGQNVRVTRRVNEGLKQLRANEALLNRVIEASQLGYWDWDLTTGLSVYSDRRYTMLGYEPSELTGCYSEWLEMVHPDDRMRVDAQLNDYLAGRIDSYRTEYRMRTKRGEWRWILDMGSITLHSEDGLPLIMSGVYADIHERKQTELALQASREQLCELASHLESVVAKRTAALTESESFTRTVLDAISAHIAVIDPDGYVLATNRAWRTFPELDVAGAMRVGEGGNYLEACYQAGAGGASSAALIADVISGAKSEGCFEYSCHAAQQQYWFQCWITRFPGDGPVRVVLTHENISARKLAEQASFNLASELNATLHAIPDLLLELDEDGVYHQVWASKKSLQVAAQKKLLGRSVRDELPPEAAQVVFDAMQEAQNTGLSQGHQIALPLSRGLRWFELSVAVKEGGCDGARCFILLSRDITERKEAEEALHRLNNELEAKVADRTAALAKVNHTLSEKEEKLRSVIEHLAGCVITTDERGAILSANHVVGHIFGYAPDEVIGQDLSLLIPEFMIYDHSCSLEHSLSSGQANIVSSGRQVVGRHKSGELITLELAVSEYIVQGQRYFTGIMHDIREQLRIMGEVEQARLEAEHANQAKSAFLATMSHEIRTPMNGVIGMIEVLQQTSLKGHQQEMVELIRDSALSLLAIIEDILDFSKIEAGKLELETTPVAVGSVVEEVCSLLDHLADKSGVELTMYTDPAIPQLVQGDPLRLRQVIINLASNAIKFSSGLDWTGRVSVRALLVEQGLDRVEVEICVADNGIGVDEETQARLFQAFTQADASTTRRFGGTGLGLAICYQLVQLMGGQIQVRSAKGQGALFTVRLPFSLVAGSGDEYAEAERRLTNLPCLVVGDGQGLAGDLAAYLRADGAVVECVPELGMVQGMASPQSGPWVWVIEAGNKPPTLERLRELSSAWPDVALGFVVIGRGWRRRPWPESPDLVRVDGNVLSRHVLLNAAAMAAGQEPLEVPGLPAPQLKGVLRLPSREEARRHGRLILVAEDNETNQKVIQHQLALLGHVADMASTGRAALERWQSGDYTLILTDLHMPEMDGYQLTTAIRQMEQGIGHIPIVALTADTRKGEAQRCLAAGMDDYLSKPTQLSSLQELLVKWLSPPVGSGAAPATQPLAADSVPKSDEPVDIRVLAALVGDDPEVIEDFLRDFQASAAKGLAELQSSYAAHEVLKVGAVAHRLKSSSRSVGALALGELFAELEEAVRADEISAVSSLLSRVEAEMAVVAAYLDARLQRFS